MMMIHVMPPINSLMCWLAVHLTSVCLAELVNTVLVSLCLLASSRAFPHQHRSTFPDLSSCHLWPRLLILSVWNSIISWPLLAWQTYNSHCIRCAFGSGFDFIHDMGWGTKAILAYARPDMSNTCMARANGTKNLTRQVIMSLLWADTKIIHQWETLISQCEVMWWLYDWIIYFVPTLLSSWTLKGCDEVNEINSLCVFFISVISGVVLYKRLSEPWRSSPPHSQVSMSQTVLRDGQDYIVNYIFIPDLQHIAIFIHCKTWATLLLSIFFS